MAVLFLNESRLLEGVQQLLGNIKSTLVSTTPPIFGCSHGYHLTNNSEGCRESLFPFLSVCQFVKKNEWDFTWSLWSQLFVPRAPSPQRGRVFCVHLGLIKMKRGGASAASAPQVLHLLEQHLSISVKKQKHTRTQTHRHSDKHRLTWSLCGSGATECQKRGMRCSERGDFLSAQPGLSGRWRCLSSEGVELEWTSSDKALTDEECTSKNVAANQRAA